MLYPSDFESRLGFDVIRQKIRDYCLSNPGKRKADSISFSNEMAQLLTLLQLNDEFKKIFESGDPFPSNHFIDPEEFIQKVSIEGNYLEEAEFLMIAYSLQTILECKEFIIKRKEFYPQLSALTEPVSISKTIPNKILSVIDENGLVKDSASPELARIRKKLRDEQSRLRRLIDQVYRYAIEQEWVPEGALPTIREGRLVIPVYAEYKRKMKGFILDESASGQTVFMEPAEVLEANNEIRDLEHSQKREVIRLLKELTDVLRSYLPELTPAFNFLAEVDVIRAKAKLSVELNAFLPIVKPHPILRWQRAFHPLLYLSLKGKREVVPLTIVLNEQHRMLLVSGPNAGGKSVCLKTVGLLQYMLQCGLLIPVSPDSEAGIFENLFVDIGDQQSIENDLSTYSSHLKNMAYFLQHTNDRTLVLLDELGAGTDPNFGGAIAQSVLKGLLEKKAWGVATTHYYNLKLFAGQHEGIRNGAMRFDEKNLQPLYLLEMGKPGSSFALEIAQKTGLPVNVLEQAEKLVGIELMGFETLVRKLEKEKNELTAREREVEKLERELKSQVSKYNALSNELSVKKKDIIQKAKLEANELLRHTNKEIEKTIRHIRENQAERKETSRVRKNLQELSKKVDQPVEKLVVQQGEVKVGDRVRIIGQEGSGIVQSIKGKNAVVQLGEIKSVIKVSNLEKVTGDNAKQVESKKPVSVGLKLYEKQAQFSPILDVRGKRVEEVVPMLDQFIDSAILLGYSEVKVIHGKGEGVLRKVVREQLRKYKQVAAVVNEHADRGGEGISIITLE